MVLDYLLTHPAQRWLTLESEKLDYFHDQLGVPLADLPQRNASGSHGARYFCDRFPAEADPNVPRFSYFDFGMVTAKAFVRHLKFYRALFTALGKFELVYVATADVNFQIAQEAFNKIMLKVNSAAPKTLLPFGVNHLVSFFEARKLWDNNSPLLTGHHVHVLREGEKLYCGAEHERLALAWENGQPEFHQVLRQLGEHSPVAGRLRTYLLGASYPVFKQPPRKETLTREAVEVAV